MVLTLGLSGCPAQAFLHRDKYDSTPSLHSTGLMQLCACKLTSTTSDLCMNDLRTHSRSNFNHRSRLYPFDFAPNLWRCVNARPVGTDQSIGRGLFSLIRAVIPFIDLHGNVISSKNNNIGYHRHSFKRIPPKQTTTSSHTFLLITHCCSFKSIYFLLLPLVNLRQERHKHSLRHQCLFPDSSH